MQSVAFVVVDTDVNVLLNMTESESKDDKPPSAFSNVFHLVLIESTPHIYFS